MATKTSSTEVIQQKKVFVKSEAALKEMEANGQLEPFTDYYTPEKDESISYKWKTFIGNAGTENYLPITWDGLSEISFRVLGNDQATFGYVHIPKELWHNDGAYILEVNCINEYGNFKGAMWFEVIGKHSNSTQIKATIKSSAQSGFTIAYR